MKNLYIVKTSGNYKPDSFERDGFELRQSNNGFLGNSYTVIAKCSSIRELKDFRDSINEVINQK